MSLLGSDILGSVVMSAVAGYVDTAGVLGLFGLFTAHITGNLVTVGTTFSGNHSSGNSIRIVMLPVFVVSVAVTTMFARSMKRLGVPALPSLLTLMTAALAIFCIIGRILRPLALQPDTWATLAISGTSVAAMGIQNALMRNSLSACSPTTIMTGNLTQCTIEIVNLVFPSDRRGTPQHRLQRQAGWHNLKKFGAPLLGFVAGTASGAWLTHVIGLQSVWVPTLAMATLSSHAWWAALRQRSMRGELMRPQVPDHRCCTISKQGGETRHKLASVAALPSRKVSSTRGPAAKHSGTFARAGRGNGTR